MATHKPELNSSLRSAVGAVGSALTAMSPGGMIIGGIGVIARGVPRTTRDVDATVRGGVLSTEGLLRELEGHLIDARIDDAAAFAEQNQVLLLRHRPSGVDVDLSIAWLPFELDAIAAAERLPLADASVPVARAEDLVIYKAVAFRPQDQSDIERLLEIHATRIDLDRVRRVVAEFAEALDEPQRSAELERIIRRALT